MLSRIAVLVLLLKGEFEREKIIFHEKNLKHKKIILLINRMVCYWKIGFRVHKMIKSNLIKRFGSDRFIFAQTYFLIASNQIFKNNAILINHGSFFQEKDSLHDSFLFLTLN